MTELILSLMTWLSSHSGYDTRLDLPNIVMTERFNMCAQYGISTHSSCEAAGLQGFYDKNVTIYLRRDFDKNDPRDQARLLHELIHYVQWQHNRHQQECLGKLEVEAYELQDLWQVQQGYTATSDTFKLMMLSAACEA